jgi:hypothetical protein
MLDRFQCNLFWSLWVYTSNRYAQFSFLLQNRENSTPKERVQNDKMENVAGSVWLSLFMDGTVKCKLPRTRLKHQQHVQTTCRAERSLRIENIISLIICTGPFYRSWSVFIGCSVCTNTTELCVSAWRIFGLKYTHRGRSGKTEGWGSPAI